jgi:hypothetical protein
MSVRATRSPFVLPAATLAVALVAASAVVVATQRLAAAGRAEEARRQRVLAEARTRFQRVGDERDRLALYAPRYRALEGIGFIGQGQRVNWVDGLRIAAEDARLAGVQYRIGAETPLPAPPPGAVGLMHSPMTIDLQLPHEGDLLRLLRALESRRAGVFMLDACAIERLGAAGEPPRPDANLRAECSLSWVTAPVPTQAPRRP